MTNESLASADSTVMSFPGTTPNVTRPWIETKQRCELGDLDRYNMANALVSGPTVRVRVLSGDMVLCSWVRHNSHRDSLNPVIQMGTGEFNFGGNLPWMG